MKRIVSIQLFFLITGFFACKTSSNCPAPDIIAPASEVAGLQQFITNNGIVAVKDNHGFFYKIVNPGSGEKPGLCSSVTVAYSGKLLNGTVFDSSTGATFPLQNLITGWQLGLPYIATGGNIVLYLPPSLAYGSSSTGSIPANSDLIFDITLNSFK